MDDRIAAANDKRQGPTCAVNSTFNYSVGAVSVAVGAALLWFGWRYFAG